MRIALVSEFFYPTLGGVQEHLYHVAREYIRAGHDCSIVTPKILKAGSVESWWPKDLPVSSYKPVGTSLPYFINGSRGRTSVGFCLGSKLKELLSHDNFDIVHLHAPLNGTLPIIANHVTTLPVVGTFHTSFPDNQSLRMLRALAQRQVDKVARIVAVSPIAHDSIARILELETEVIPNGVDTKSFKPLAESQDDRLKQFLDGKVNILFIGRPDRRNGLDTLIRALSTVLKMENNVRLLVAGGGGEMDRYKKMCSYLPEGSVVFLGPVREERPALYRTAHIHAFPVEKATFSITVLEGMSSGLPVITTPFDGHRALGVPGQHFLATPFGEDAPLAEALLNLIRDKELRTRLSQAARARSLEFDWSVIAGRYLKVYESVLKEEGLEVAPPRRAFASAQQDL